MLREQIIFSFLVPYRTLFKQHIRVVKMPNKPLVVIKVPICSSSDEIRLTFFYFLIPICTRKEKDIHSRIY